MLSRIEKAMKKTSEVCLPNYYAVELLEQAGLNQELINLVESLLINEKLTSLQDSLLNKFCLKIPSTSKKVLLIESNTFLLKAHTILINNCGYLVDTATTSEEVVAKSDNTYHAIFVRVNQENLNGWMSARIFQADTPQKRPKIFLLLGPNEKDPEIRKYFLNQGVDDIFDLPLNMRELERAKNQINHNGE